MFGSLFAGMLVGAAMLTCLIAWGERAYGGGAAGLILALAALLVVLALIVFAWL